MNRSQSALLAAITLGLALPPLACGEDRGERSNTPDNELSTASYGANYGDDRIGYRFSAEARDAAWADADSDPSLGGDGDGDGNFDGSYGTGGTSGLGGYGGSPAQRSTRIRPAQLTGGSTGLEYVPENPFVVSDEENTSTFSIDVDTGSYTLARAAVRDGFLPAPESVRIEEFLNYFHFHYKEPEGDRPLALYTELAACPWNPERELLLIGVQGQEVDLEGTPPMNLVYLIDVSGSMNDPLKLPLLKRGFRLLTSQLRPQDRVSIVTYASSDRVVIDGASGADREEINQAIEDLVAGGSTNGAGGIQKAYELAQEHFIAGGTNRVLLATDGDFNVGISSVDDLVNFISEKRDSGVFLSVYGYGAAWDGGNYQDQVGEQLADNGNGIYFYIDGPEETQRAFMHTVSGSLITVAKDVKLQMEFNPAFVKGYRLIGYENRVLSNSSFNDGSVDAGELGAGLSVTALYEIIREDASEDVPLALPGTVPPAPEEGSGDSAGDAGFEPAGANEVMQVRLRYKESGSDESQAMSQGVRATAEQNAPSLKLLFAAAVSEFAMQLRGSQYLPDFRDDPLTGQIHQTLILDKEGAIQETLTFVDDAHALWQ